LKSAAELCHILTDFKNSFNCWK